MKTFRYTVRTSEGKIQRGRLKFEDRDRLFEDLRRRKWVPISVTEEAEAPRSSSFGRGGVPLTEIVLFARQLATMMNAGIPILQALEIVGEQTEHRVFRSVLNDVAKKVAAGTSMSRAMGAHQRIFSDFFVYTVRAGEESGNLDEILNRVATYLEKTEKIIRKVKSAMIYPAVVMTMALLITLLMMVKVIPVFVEMYAGFDVELPLATRALIGTSDFLRTNLLAVLGGAGVLAFLLNRAGRTPQGAYLLDRVKLNFPVFGLLMRKAAISKFTRTLGTLLKSGVPILRAMDIVAKTSGNRVIEEAVLGSVKSVREGKKITEPLAAAKVFPPMVIRMISVGETSGEMEAMLEKISDFYDEQVDAAVSGLTSLIEPFVIAFLGVVIGGIVIAMFLPIFSMVNAVGM